MNIIPFEKVVLNSELNATELIERLKDYIEPFHFSWNNFRNSSKLYVGKVGNNEFGITRIIRGRNSFLPYIHGRIKEKENNIDIIITMRLHVIAMVVLLFFVGSIIWGAIKYHEYIALMLVLFLYLMTLYFFNEECTIAKNDLQNLLETDKTHV